MNLDPYRSLIAHLYPGAQLEAMVRLTGGVSADVYRLDLRHLDGRGEPLVLRAHGASHSGHPAALEYQLLRALFDVGLTVPQALHVDTSVELLPDPFLLMTFVEGSTTVPVGQELEYIDVMAATLIGIHDTSIHAVPQLPTRIDPLPEVFEYLPQAAEWNPLRAHLASLSNTAYQGLPKLLHGDFWPENLLWHDGAIAAILDWEDAAVGDPLSDVAGCSLELRYKYGVTGMQRFIEAYAKRSSIDLNRLALWQIYVAAAAQCYMGEWGLDEALEAHMRTEALATIRDAGAVMMLP